MMKNRFTYGFSWFCFWLILIGCQNPKTEITADEDQLILSDTELFEMVRNITLKDGSADNIIDNASCLSVVYPIEVKANGEPVLLTEENDLELVSAIHDREKYDVDAIDITFPIQLITSEHQIVDVVSENELSDMSRLCVEGGDDPDIECIDFVYPMDIRTYHGAHQKLQIRSLADDAELFTLLGQLENSGWISFQYPLNMVQGGSPGIVTSNSHFLNTLDDVVDACDENDEKYYDDTILPVPTGKLKVSVTDAPFPIDMLDSAKVNGSGIEVRKVEEDTSYFITVSEEEFSFDLLTLTNGVTFDVVEINIPVGTYDEVRIHISDAELVLTDGRKFDLKIPGSQSSGLKVKIHPDITINEGGLSELLLDFDLSRSFVVQGNQNNPDGINGFLFKPVVKAVNLAATGTLSGTVMTLDEVPVSDVQVSLFIADTLNTTTFSEENGQFMVLGLQAGIYTVEMQANGYKTASIEDLVMESGEQKVVNVTLEIE